MCIYNIYIISHLFVMLRMHLFQGLAGGWALTRIIHKIELADYHEFQ